MRPAALLALTALALAGCATPASDLPAALPSEERIELTGCMNIGAVFGVPETAARGVMPAGFEPVTLAADAEGRVLMYVIGVACDAGDVNGAPVGRATVLYAELAVIPPADEAIAGAADHTMPVLFLAHPAPLGDAFASLQFGVSGAGDLSHQVTLDPQAVRVVRFDASAGAISITLTGEAIPASAAALGAGAFGVFGVKEKELRTRILGAASAGEATLATVSLEARGDAPLLADARPAARGFSVSGFDLSFTRIVEASLPASPAREL